MVFQIGQRVRIIHPSTYGGVGVKGDIGIVVRIRERYRQTPNEYVQYRVFIENKYNSGMCTSDDMYESYAIISLDNSSESPCP